MKLVLNGWQRLWVFISIMLLVPVTIAVVITFPNPDNVKHKSSFIDNLSPASLAKLAPADEKGIVWDDQVGLKVKMPNGYLLRFKKSISKGEAEDVSSEYYDFLRHQTNKERAIRIFLAIASWLGTAVVLYAFGWGIGWVYKGFKNSL